MADPKPADGKSADTDNEVSDAVAKATARIQAILGCEEAAGREALAQEFAYRTELTAEQAIKALATAAKTSNSDVAGGGGIDEEAYERERLLGSGQGNPGGQAPPAKAAWSTAVANTNKRFK